MEFRLINNHIIVDVDTNLGKKACVFDTGSPETFFFDNVDQYSMEGRTYQTTSNLLGKMVRASREKICDLISKDIDGFIGFETFCNTGVVINFPARQLHFSDTLQFSDSVEMDNITGLPVFNIKVNGKEVLATFDSGAMYAFVSSQLEQQFDLCSKNSTINDYNPMIGNIVAELYEGEIGIGNTSLGNQNITVGQGYDRALGMLKILGMNVGVFIGVDTLKNSKIGISYTERKFGFL